MADPELRTLAERLQACCTAAGITVATAESCTGGRVADALTDVPGSSGYVRGGIIAYADVVKVDLLGVAAELLRTHGAVSAQVARAMAAGARARCRTDLAIAVTGIAGPDGATPGKPVGLTYLAVAGPHEVVVARHTWEGDREANKLASARAALGLLLAAAEALAAGAADTAQPDDAAP